MSSDEDVYRGDNRRISNASQQQPTSGFPPDSPNLEHDGRGDGALTNSTPSDIANTDDGVKQILFSDV